jgi:hypothetical protein
MSKAKATVAQTVTMMIKKLLETIPENNRLPFETKMVDRVEKATNIYIHNTSGVEAVKQLIEVNRKILLTHDIKIGKEINEARVGLCVLFSLLPSDLFAIQHAVLIKEAQRHCQENIKEIPSELLIQGLEYIQVLYSHYNIVDRGTPISPKKSKNKKPRDKSKKKKVTKKKKLSSSTLKRRQAKKEALDKLRMIVLAAKAKKDNYDAVSNK